jgi:hypothetical protein
MLDKISIDNNDLDRIQILSGSIILSDKNLIHKNLMDNDILNIQL